VPQSSATITAARDRSTPFAKHRFAAAQGVTGALAGLQHCGIRRVEILKDAPKASDFIYISELHTGVTFPVDGS
jgi:hypothetical protein